MTTFIVPCFIVVQAPSLEDAINKATKHQTMKNDSVLLLDEELPAVTIQSDVSIAYPHSMTKIPALRHYFR
jgi:hypothetical protein